MIGGAAVLAALTLAVSFFLLGSIEREVPGRDAMRSVAQAQWSRDGGASWQTVPLPHHIERSLPQPLRSQYRVVLRPNDAIDRSQVLGVCIERWSMNGRVSLAGKPVGGFGRLDDPITRWNQRPTGFTIPPRGEADPPDIELTIDLASLPSLDPGLGAIRYGPREAVQDHCERIDSSRRMIGETFAFALFVVGTFAAVQAWRWRDATAFWFALSIYLIGFKPTYTLVTHPPWSDWSWTLLYYLGRNAYVPATLTFCYRFIGGERATIPVAIWGMHLAALGVLVALPWAYWWQWLLGITVLYTLVGLPALYAVQRHAWRNSRSFAWFLLIAIVYVFVESMADVTYWLLRLPSDQKVRTLLLVPVLMTGIALLLVERQATRHAREVRIGEELRAQLEQQRRELDLAYRQLAEERAHEAAESSRRRILRDMHDGVGSRLVAASALFSSPSPDRDAIAQSLDAALMELRMTVDALSPEQRNAETLLGAFRYRVEPMLQARGIALDWDIAEIPASFAWGDETRLQVVRMLQEIVSNMVKHAEARRFRVAAAIGARGELVIETVDDGRGFDPGAATHGNGLRNLRDRAAEAGVSIQIVSSPGSGTHVRLAIRPDNAAAQAP